MIHHDKSLLPVFSYYTIWRAGVATAGRRRNAPIFAQSVLTDGNVKSFQSGDENESEKDLFAEQKESMCKSRMKRCVQDANER